jgi:hypothetical protein
MVFRDKRQAEPGSPGHEISILALPYYSVFEIERQIWDLRVIKETRHGGRNKWDIYHDLIYWIVIRC